MTADQVLARAGLILVLGEFLVSIGVGVAGAVIGVVAPCTGASTPAPQSGDTMILLHAVLASS